MVKYQKNRENNIMAKLKAAIVTDIHLGPNRRAKLGKRAPALLEKFIKSANKGAANIIVDLGDRISCKNPEKDAERAKAVKDIFNKAAAPVSFVMGNHDVHNLSRVENEKITGSPATSWSKDEGGYHLIFFNPGADAGPYLSVGESDLDWLKTDLAATDKPTIVFSHVPLDNSSEQKDKIYPENRALHGRFGYSIMGTKVRDIMEKSGKVILCMSGHLHDDSYREINGIHYITQQSLTHLHRDHYKIPSNSWSWLELEDGKITIRRMGKSKREYNLIPRAVA